MMQPAFLRWVAVAALFAAPAAPGLYAQSQPLKVTSFAPREVSYLGKTPFEITGEGFNSDTRVKIGAAVITPALEGTTRLTGILPPHESTAEPIPVVVFHRTGDVTLDPGVRYIGPLTASRVAPDAVEADVAGRVTIYGVGFTPQTAVQIGTTVLSQRTFLDARRIQGVAPALPAGRYNVKVSEVSALGPTISHTLEGGLTYAKLATLPGPQQIETSLAEGTARFSWFNPIAYDQILVLDANDKPIRTLSGNTQFLELDAGGLDEMAIQLRGVVSAEPTRISLAHAKIFDCRPQPIAGSGTPGDLSLALRGGHEPAEVERCGPDPAAGGGGAGGALVQGPVRIQDLGRYGMYQDAASIGALRPEWIIRLHGQPNSLVTGFLLAEDATVLEVSGFYEKIQGFPGLSLRARITQVATPEDPDLEDGFTDELTFPDVTIGGGKKWNVVNYYRADKDVSYVPNPNDPNDKAPQPCLDEHGEVRRIPRGEYLLEIYAVGGNVDEQYYDFADDSREFELLIPGVPCPPYPMVRVRDMTGKKTLPTVLKVAAATLGENPKPFVRLFVEEGSWLDEAGFPHYIGPEGEPDSPDFEYVWTIYDKGGVPTTVSSGSASSISTEVQDWGCYYIDLTVKDKGCPRSIRRSFQIAVAPEQIACTVGEDQFSFLFPTPEPSGIKAIAGLNPAPGSGTFENTRPVEFRVLIAPSYYCLGEAGSAVFVGDEDSDVQFTLATKRTLLNGTVLYVPIPEVQVTVTDLCPNVQDGVKYLHVLVDDLGKIPEIPDVEGPRFRSIYFVAKTVFFYQGPGNDQRFPVANDPWRPVGPPLRIANHPPMLDDAYWTGYFDEASATYHFSVQASAEPRERFGFGKSNDIPLPIEGLPPGTGIPSFDNDLTTGFNARFKVVGEEYLSDNGTGGAYGKTLGNEMEGSPLSIEGSTTVVSALQGEGGGSSLPEYHWEDCRDIFHSSFSQSIFDSMLFSGFIGPVPVTVWASIGLGIDILIESRTFVDVRPFAALEGSGKSSVESHAFVLGDVNLSIPCEIRADVLLGVASITARLIPQANLSLDSHVGVLDTSPQVGARISAALSLLFEIEACIWALVDEVCYSPGAVKILDEEPIIEKTIGQGVPDTNSPQFQCQDTLAARDAAPDGAGGGVDPTFKLLSTSRPSTAVSFDGDTTLYCHAVEAPEGTFDGARTLGVMTVNPDVPFNIAGVIHDVIDPAAAFVAAPRALVAWTRGGTPQGPIPYIGLDVNNYIATLQDILITPFAKTPSGAWTHGGEPTFFRVSDDPAEVPVASRRADGMAAIAADASPASQQAGGEALVVWVRYDGPFLVEDGTKTRVYNPTLVPRDGKLRPFFNRNDVDTVRPNLEHTGIFVRRVGASAVIGPPARISPASVGINVEPTIATSPSGETSYCVWVHDSSVDPVTNRQHVNLVDSNLGRNLMISVFTKATGVWSPPTPIFPDPDLYPAMLEPSISLSGNFSGLLAFTALSTDASKNDSGLANNRYVFACRLDAGAFGVPVLIHGKCLGLETGHWPTAWAAPPDFFDDLVSRPGDFLITYHGTGPSGSRAGAGNVMLTALSGDVDRWTAPTSLTRDGNIHSNVSAAISRKGRIRTFHLNGGPASVLAGSGGGVTASRTMAAIDTALEPDPAIVSCQLSDAFPAPGSKVTATIGVENSGLAATPVDGANKSLLGVEAYFIGSDGKQRRVAETRIPVLPPGSEASVSLALEMPHEPVRLRVVLSTGGSDRDETNNARECFFGAPAPGSLQCSVAFYAGEESAEGDEIKPVARLFWSNTAVYDSVLVYRDGGMIASLAGGATAFVDSYAEPARHVYEVRGAIGASKSPRAACDVDLTQGPPAEQFRRGDSDLSSRLDITDAVKVLGYLFLGSSSLPCPDAADADDNGRLEITDAIRILGYLFLGDAAPPAPGPTSCGTDLTGDQLPTCEGACN